MRPRFEELLGWSEAAKLSFWQREEQYGFRFGDEEFVTDRDMATRLVYGTTEETPGPAMSAQGRLAAVLRTILPLPGLWYGINYV